MKLKNQSFTNASRPIKQGEPTFPNRSNNRPLRQNVVHLGAGVQSHKLKDITSPLGDRKSGKAEPLKMRSVQLYSEEADAEDEDASRPSG
jgi:hypothetical protein